MSRVGGHEWFPQDPSGPGDLSNKAMLGEQAIVKLKLTVDFSTLG